MTNSTEAKTATDIQVTRVGPSLLIQKRGGGPATTANEFESLYNKVYQRRGFT